MRNSPDVRDIPLYHLLQEKERADVAKVVPIANFRQDFLVFPM